MDTTVEPPNLSKPKYKSRVMKSHPLYIFSTNCTCWLELKPLLCPSLWYPAGATRTFNVQLASKRRWGGNRQWSLKESRLRGFVPLSTASIRASEMSKRNSGQSREPWRHLTVVEGIQREIQIARNKKVAQSRVLRCALVRLQN